jgi:hypothetical protein
MANMPTLTLLIKFLGSLFKSHRQLALENLALRQLVTMLRKSVKRPRATAANRMFRSKRDVNKRKETTKHPDTLDDPSPIIYPKPLHPITTVEYVKFVGCKWSFYPGVGPYFFLDRARISAREI